MRQSGIGWFWIIGVFLVGAAVCLASSQLKADQAYEYKDYLSINEAFSQSHAFDPLFVPDEAVDYHLDNLYSNWIIDGDHSPCIDAGDPEDSVGLESFPNGRRINMGAYGGTPKASRSGTYILHVNANGWGDSYATIQSAVDDAIDGDIVLVWPGVYQEEVTFRGKAITVRSADSAAVIEAPNYAFSFYGAESSRSVLRNFIISNCGIAAIFCDGASPTLSNLTIVNNRFGITTYGGSDPSITNCILWNNSDGDLFQCSARYSCFRNSSGDGNISRDPLFVDPVNGDYHLQSRFCRYSPGDDEWITDFDHSPCIDAGDPGDLVGSEPYPNGEHINMGAYGGTPEASRSDTDNILHVDGDYGISGAYTTIQSAVNAASNGDTILVWPGIYQEQVSIIGKEITLQSADDAPVIEAPNGYAFSFYGAESSWSLLRNFVITNCGQGAILCDSASPTLSNLTIVNNRFGIKAEGGADPRITNCIIWNNETGDLSQCRARYSCIRNESDRGNISTEPLFVDPDNGDYHLQSINGSFSP